MILKATDSTLRKSLGEFLLAYVRQTNRITLSFEGLEKNLQKAVALHKYGLDLAVARYQSKLEGTKVTVAPVAGDDPPRPPPEKHLNVSEVYHKLLRERDRPPAQKKLKVQRAGTAALVLSSPTSPCSSRHASVGKPGMAKPSGTLPVTKQPSQRMMCQRKGKKRTEEPGKKPKVRTFESCQEMLKELRIEVVPAEPVRPKLRLNFEERHGIDSGNKLIVPREMRRSGSTAKTVHGPKKVSLHDSLTESQLVGALEHIAASHKSSFTYESQSTTHRERSTYEMRPGSISTRNNRLALQDCPQAKAKVVVTRRGWR